MNFVFFFFSSRRRHTRCSRDWSSDVCSSDLAAERGALLRQATAALLVDRRVVPPVGAHRGCRATGAAAGCPAGGGGHDSPGCPPPRARRRAARRGCPALVCALRRVRALPPTGDAVRGGDPVGVYGVAVGVRGRVCGLSFESFKPFICGGPEMAPALPQWRTTGSGFVGWFRACVSLCARGVCGAGGGGAREGSAGAGGAARGGGPRAVARGAAATDTRVAARAG